MRLLPIALASLSPVLAAQAVWSTPVPEATLNSSAADSGPFLTADGKTVYFSSFRSTNWELYSSTRAGRGQPWGAPALETALNDPTGTEDQPCLSADGLEIYFSSTRAGGLGGSDLMRSTRLAPVLPWSAPTFVTELNSSAAESAPTLTGDGLTLYLLSARTGAPAAPNNAIFVSTRPNKASPWTTPVLVTELSTVLTHRDVEVSENGNEITYTRFNSTTSRIEVILAKRAKPGDKFGTPAVLPEFAGVGTSLGVYSFTVSLDRTEALLAAGFATAAGGQEILSTRLTGLGQHGLCTSTSDLVLTFRDPATPGKAYAGAFALGDTGFMLGTRTVPLDPDAVFVNLFGGIPPVTTAYSGVLDANGEATAKVRTLFPFLIGIKLYTGFFSIDYTQPFNVSTISNSLPFEFLP